MTAPGHATSAGDDRLREAEVVGENANGRAVSARARELAARLSALFHQDSLIVGRLNDAQRRLLGANERLWSGLSPDGSGLIYDDVSQPAGRSEIAGLMGDAHRVGGRDTDASVLSELRQIHAAIRRAFYDYQDACEERRPLAVEVGELSGQLAGVLCAAGWSVDEAQDADVHVLAGAGSGERRGEAGCQRPVPNQVHVESHTR